MIDREVFQKVHDLFKSTHWSQHSYEEEKGDKTVYCAIGGIAHVLALDPDDERVNEYAKALVVKMPDLFFYCFANEGEKEEVTDELIASVKAGTWKENDKNQGNFYHSIVIAYNDYEDRRLEEVLALFAEAAS
jgi:hypothetical protein